MNKYILVVLLLIGQQINAQFVCGFDQMRQHHCEEHDSDGSLESQMNNRILDEVVEYMNSGIRGGGEVYTIPVVVHVIHEGGPENISDEQIELGISHMNQAFSNTGDYFDMDNIDTGIQFCLAQKDPDGNLTNGINRVNSSLTDVNVPSEESEMKALSQWDSNLYLNIWIVKAITRDEDNEGVIGFATFPDTHGEAEDGLVIEAEFFGSSLISSTCQIHEAGHYLGLYHTFQDGCPNGDCLTQGDRVCDTPPDQHVFNSFCYDGTNSCMTDEDDTSDNNPFRPESEGGLGDQFDMQDNFMDYSSLICFNRFTPGQADRMIAALLTFRPSLLEGDRCTAPCDSPITVEVVSSATEINVGESVSFNNNSSNVTNYEWYVNGTLESEDEDFSYTFNEEGENTIILIMSNDTEGCEQEIEFEINVTCPIIASFNSDGTQFDPGDEVFFENQSSGEGSLEYAWLIDGEFVSDETNLTYVFDEVGGYSLSLVAFNDVCSVSSTPLFITSGLCSSGNEHNIWHFFNPIGNTYGFDFNSGEVSNITENPLPDETGHSKSTICDPNGNLLFVSKGFEVVNKNYEVLPNGSDLLGSFSSHFGTAFMKAPGSDHLYYLFTSDSQENNFEEGLRYSIIDTDLDDGLGDVTDIKNELVETINAEAISTVSHCNLVDFWLIFYDLEESVYKSYLVTSSGIGEEPIVSEISQEGEILYRSDLRVSPRGDMIIHGNYLLSFNQQTGEFELIYDFNFDLVIAHEFSPNGKVLYMETGVLDVFFRQFNLELSIDDMLANEYSFQFESLADIGFDMKLGPDGKIYKEEVISGNISVINNPNIIGEDMDYEDNAVDAQALINSFGNFHHGYISGISLFIEGPDEMCEGESVEYSVFNSGCIPEVLMWEVEGTDFNELESGIEINPSVADTILVRVSVNSNCGLISGEKTVIIKPNPSPDLGEDRAICFEDSIELYPGEYDSYLWSTDDTLSTIEAELPGIYSVLVESNGCLGSDEIELGPVFGGIIDLGDDTELCDSEILLLEISDFWLNPVWQDGSTGNQYTVYEGGSYSVTVSEPCVASDEITVDDCGGSIIGVEELTESTAPLAFPNPASDAINFVNISSFDQISIYNAMGQLVETLTINHINTLEIGLNNYASGSYRAVLTTIETSEVISFSVTK